MLLLASPLKRAVLLSDLLALQLETEWLVDISYKILDKYRLLFGEKKKSLEGQAETGDVAGFQV